MTYGKKEEQIFLGREIAQHRDFSDDTAKQIDAEVRSFVDTAYKSAYTILDANQDIMHRMAAALLERETLDAAEIKLIIEGKELPAAKSALAGVDPGSAARPRRSSSPKAAASPASAKASLLPHKLLTQHRRKAAPVAAFSFSMPLLCSVY